MGLTRGSYEAFCFDQAVWYFGSYIEGEVEKAGQKSPRGEQARMMAARKRVLKRLVEGKDAKGQYADPAAFFS